MPGLAKEGLALPPLAEASVKTTGFCMCSFCKLAVEKICCYSEKYVASRGWWRLKNKAKNGNRDPNFAKVACQNATKGLKSSRL